MCPHCQIVCKSLNCECPINRHKIASHETKLVNIFRRHLTLHDYFMDNILVKLFIKTFSSSFNYEG